MLSINSDGSNCHHYHAVCGKYYPNKRFFQFGAPFGNLGSATGQRPNSLLRDIFPSPSEINMLKAAEKRTEQKWNNPQLVLFPREAVAKLRQSCMHSCAALGFDTPTIC